MTKTSPLIVALDYNNPKDAMALAAELKGQPIWFKIGLELMMNGGIDLAKQLTEQGNNVFLDGKFMDIPNTVAGAVRGVTSMGVKMLNVHALGGTRMMRAAKEASIEQAEKLGITQPLVIAVTILTSVAEEELKELGFKNDKVSEQVVLLAKLAKEAGLDGVVSSVHEAKMIREACGEDFVIVTPGIRLDDSTSDDQRRIATPKLAIEEGASHIVVGRPITKAEDKIAVCQKILADIC